MLHFVADKTHMPFVHLNRASVARMGTPQALPCPCRSVCPQLLGSWCVHFAWTVGTSCCEAPLCLWVHLACSYWLSKVSTGRPAFILLSHFLTASDMINPLSIWQSCLRKSQIFQYVYIHLTCFDAEDFLDLGLSHLSEEIFCLVFHSSTKLLWRRCCQSPHQSASLGSDPHHEAVQALRPAKLIANLPRLSAGAS